MSRFFATGILITTLALSAAAQDWYHDREERFHGEGGGFIFSRRCEPIWNMSGKGERAIRNATDCRKPRKN